MSRITPPLGASASAGGLVPTFDLSTVEAVNENGFPHASGTNYVVFRNDDNALQRDVDTSTVLTVVNRGLYIGSVRFGAWAEHDTADTVLYQIDAINDRDVRGYLSQEDNMPAIPATGSGTADSHVITLPPFYVDPANDVNPTTFRVVVGITGDTWKITQCRFTLVRIADGVLAA